MTRTPLVRTARPRLITIYTANATRQARGTVQTTRADGNEADFRLLLLRLRHYARKARWIAETPVHSPADTVHELRILGKRSRSLLKLCHNLNTDPSTTELENGIREAMHRLGPVRDRSVEADLVRRYSKAPWCGPPEDTGNHPSAAMTSALVHATHYAAREMDAASQAISPSFDIRSALQASYRNARKRWRREVRQPSSERLHRWRIASKTLFYQIEAMSLHGTLVRKRILRRLKSIGSLLGEAHDLALLVERNHDRLSRKERNRIAETYNRKRRKALKLGESALEPEALGLQRNFSALRIKISS